MYDFGHRTGTEVGFYKGTEAGTAVQTRTNLQFFGMVDAH